MPIRFANYSLVTKAAFVWGLMSFLPVGMTYLSAVLLILAVLVQRSYCGLTLGARWRQVRGHLVFWPLCAFLIWSAVVLVLGQRYAETPSNMFHVVRIVLTMVLVLSLWPQEARAGLIGWAIGAMLALMIIYLNQIVALPHVAGLRDLLYMYGNKSIGIAVSLAIFSCCSLVYALGQKAHPARRWWALPMVVVIPVLMWLLPSRTSLLLIAISMLLGLVHLLKKRPMILASSIVVLLMSGIVMSQVPFVQKRFVLGWSQLHLAAENPHDASLMNSSWGLRYLFYTKTADMVAERPLMGWGIGSWNDQWKKRTPANVHAANMPHNDFLWIGSQAGIPGMLALLAIMLALLLSAVPYVTPAATASIVASSGLLVAMSFNSALRDAQIGMSILFVVLALNVIATEQRNESLVPAE